MSDIGKNRDTKLFGSVKNEIKRSFYIASYRISIGLQLRRTFHQYNIGRLFSPLLSVLILAHNLPVHLNHEP